MKTNNVELEMMAADLPLEVTRGGQLCPFCRGGDNHDRSFSITRKANGTVAYMCHRAKCGVHGYFVDNREAQPAPPTTFRDKFTGPTCELSPEMVKWFKSRYGFISFEITAKAGFRWAYEENKVYQPVWNLRGEQRGVVLRDYNKKSIRYYPEQEGAHLAWYRCPDQSPASTLVIVEDQLSALKLSRIYDACALLGTALSPDRVMEIARHIAARQIDHTILLLDPDVYGHAITLMQRWGTLLKGLRVEQTEQDPKYWDASKILALEKPRIIH